MPRRWMLAPIAALALGAGIALPIAVGGAQSSPQQLRFTNDEGTMHLDDVAPLGMNKGSLSQGDRITHTRAVFKDGKRFGTFATDAVITNRTPKPWPKFTANVTGVAHLADGDLFTMSSVDAAHGGERATVIIGGSGAYAGKTGTIVGDDKGAVVTFNP